MGAGRNIWINHNKMNWLSLQLFSKLQDKMGVLSEKRVGKKTTIASLSYFDCLNLCRSWISMRALLERLCCFVLEFTILESRETLDFWFSDNNSQLSKLWFPRLMWFPRLWWSGLERFLWRLSWISMESSRNLRLRLRVLLPSLNSLSRRSTLFPDPELDYHSKSKMLLDNNLKKIS